MLPARDFCLEGMERLGVGILFKHSHEIREAVLAGMPEVERLCFHIFPGQQPFGVGRDGQGFFPQAESEILPAPVLEIALDLSGVAPIGLGCGGAVLQGLVLGGGIFSGMAPVHPLFGK